jgi:hypothetical protein
MPVLRKRTSHACCMMRADIATGRRTHLAHQLRDRQKL